MNNKKERPRRRGVLWMGAWWSLAAVTAVGCGWSLLTEHSVRFNPNRSDRAFYRLPPLPVAYDPLQRKELTVVETYDYGEYHDAEAAEEPDTTAMWESAIRAINRKELEAAREGLRKYLDATQYSRDGSDQERRGSAVDMLDAMAALDAGSAADSVWAYLKARNELHSSALEAVSESIPELSADKGLADNWAYLRAALDLRSERKEEALAAFLEIPKRFPQSEKLPAAEYSAAKIYLERSASFDYKKCGSGSNNEEGPDSVATRDSASCRDDDWGRALAIFTKLSKDGGRYRNDARGWVAFLHQRGGEPAKALAEYYRLLGDPGDRVARLRAKHSLQYLGHIQDDSVLDETERLIIGEPDAALAYAYHRIYNHAVDYSYREFSTWCCYGDDKWSQIDEERKDVRESLETGQNELKRVARFATAALRRHPQARVSGGFTLRLAQAQLELQSFHEALQSARKALSKGLRGDERADALWVKGSAEHRSGAFAEARRTFSQLLTEFPDQKLTEGARRLLAITAEDQGDLEFALDQYIALRYEYDVAHFLDVLMPIERLAKYASDRDGTPMRDRLLYALGVRYMRERRWEEARSTLRKVRTDASSDLERSWGNEEMHGRFPKIPDWELNEEDSHLIESRWVSRDLKTIDILEGMERASGAAQGDEARAEAMYQLASFYFESSALLLYNSSAWEGGRYHLLSELSVSQNMRLPGEPEVIFDHFQSHDTLARAIPIYLEIADRFPDTKAAKDALYSAAVAHERLSNLNPYWRNAYANGLFAGGRMVSYADVRKKFPNYQLPKATYGWEPSTRTVNGGPAWAPKPKAPSKLSWPERAARKFSKWYERYSPSVLEPTGSFAANLFFYTKVHLYMVFVSLMGVFVLGNRSRIRKGFKLMWSRSPGVVRSLRKLVTLFLARASRPRLSITYLLTRIYKAIRRT